MYPERVPALTAADLSASLDRIVEHNQGGARVFFTFTNQALLESFNLTQVGRVYEASVR